MKLHKGMVYPPLGRYEKYPVKDSALLATAADNFFWTFEQVMAYCKFIRVNYIGLKSLKQTKGKAPGYTIGMFRRMISVSLSGVSGQPR